MFYQFKLYDLCLLKFISETGPRQYVKSSLVPVIAQQSIVWVTNIHSSKPFCVNVMI